MKMLFIFIGALAVSGFLITLYIYRDKKDIKPESKKSQAKFYADDFEKERMEFLRKNLSVPGVTKNSDFHEKRKKKY